MKNIFVLFLSLAFHHNSNAYDARFNNSTSILDIPYISLTSNSSSVFDADLMLTGTGPLTFSLNNLNTSTLSGINGATYNPSTMVVTLPRVLAGTSFFTASLTRNDSGAFVVTSAQANPYAVNRGQSSSFTFNQTAADSLPNSDGSTERIRAYLIGDTRYEVFQPRSGVTLKYAVHEAENVTTPKALVILIPGGSFNAFLTGDEASKRLDFSGSNFNIRTAHFYAQLGFRAISLDSASDALSFYSGSDTSRSFRYDFYRVSDEARTDTAAVINRENAEGLPVFILGTSRGAISAFALSTLADGVSISSPVTRSGAGGHPIGQGGSSSVVQPENIQVPTHILYHVNDGCSGTQPDNTVEIYNRMVNDGKDVTMHALSGGFVDSVVNDVCGPLDFHGFLGIEAAAAGQTAAWINDVIANP